MTPSIHEADGPQGVYFDIDTGAYDQAGIGILARVQYRALTCVGYSESESIEGMARLLRRVHSALKAKCDVGGVIWWRDHPRSHRSFETDRYICQARFGTQPPLTEAEWRAITETPQEPAT